MRIAFIAAPALLGSEAPAGDGLAIVVVIPEAVEATGFAIDVCGGEPCVAHGCDVVPIDLEVTGVMLGPVAKGAMTVAATNGFLRHRKRPSRDNRHLFVLRELADRNLSGQVRWVVTEADPIVRRRACTVLPIEDCLSNVVWLAVDVWDFAAEGCLSMRRIGALAARRGG